MVPTEYGGHLRAYCLKYTRFFDPLTFKNLKPATIAGFAAAIADHLYLFGQELSKSLDLNRPIASVYRDKTTANRGVASRDLPLLLLVFTKAPY